MSNGIILDDDFWLEGAMHLLSLRLNVPPPAFPSPMWKKKGKVMDYIPSKRTDRYLWLKNLSNNVVVEAAKFGGLPADATAMKALADGMIAKMDATEAASVALDAAREIEVNTEKTTDAAIRLRVKNWKTLSGYPASGSEAVLRLKGTSEAFDHTTYKPVIKVSQEADIIKVSFTKKGVDSLAIYSRLRGTAAWTQLDVDTTSPYDDTRALAVAGVPEAREYMARGVLNDEEIGLDSDIASITFAG